MLERLIHAESHTSTNSSAYVDMIFEMLRTLQYFD